MLRKDMEIRKDEDSQKERERSVGMRMVGRTVTVGKDKDTWDGRRCLVWTRMVGGTRMLGKEDTGEG